MVWWSGPLAEEEGVGQYWDSLKKGAWSMSPQNNPSLWQWVLGLWAGLLTFLLGHNYYRINSMKEEATKPCVEGSRFDKRLRRIEQKVPSGDVTCASNEEVTLIFEKLDEMAVALTKTSTILEERLPKK